MLLGEAGGKKIEVGLGHMHEGVRLGAQGQFGPEQVGMGVEPVRQGVLLAPREDGVALDVMGIEQNARTPPLYAADKPRDTLCKLYREHVVHMHEIDPCGRQKCVKLGRQAPRGAIAGHDGEGVVAPGVQPLEAGAHPAPAHARISHGLDAGIPHGGDGVLPQIRLVAREAPSGGDQQQEYAHAAMGVRRHLRREDIAASAARPGRRQDDDAAGHSADPELRKFRGEE